MAEIVRLRPEEVTAEEIVRRLREGSARLVHLQGLMFGATVFRDGLTGRLCVQVNASIACPDSTEEVLGVLREALARAERVLVFPPAG